MQWAVKPHCKTTEIGFKRWPVVRRSPLDIHEGRSDYRCAIQLARGLVVLLHTRQLRRLRCGCWKCLGRFNLDIRTRVAEPLEADANCPASASMKTPVNSRRRLRDTLGRIPKANRKAQLSRAL
jgi:hypothetical protein